MHGLHRDSSDSSTEWSNNALNLWLESPAYIRLKIIHQTWITEGERTQMSPHVSDGRSPDDVKIRLAQHRRTPTRDMQQHSVWRQSHGAWWRLPTVLSSSTTCQQKRNTRHNLKLKNKAIIMLLRNLDVSEGMCNGTRLIVTELCNNIIKAKIITGEHAGRQVHIPRITFDSSKSELGATMQRHQFPVTPAFAITIHKSQGQTFEFVGVLLLTTVFVHGMLYVAFSRVKRQSALKILLPPENPTHTRNVVWKEVLNKRNSPAAPASPTRNYLDNMEDFAIDD